MAFNFAKKLTLSGLVMLVVVAGASGIMKPSFALTNGGNITAVGVPLTEDFDALAAAGTGVAWTDNTTIPGVYAVAHDLQRRNRIIEHGRALQLWRCWNESD